MVVDIVHDIGRSATSTMRWAAVAVAGALSVFAFLVGRDGQTKQADADARTLELNKAELSQCDSHAIKPQLQLQPRSGVAPTGHGGKKHSAYIGEHALSGLSTICKGSHDI